MLSDVVIFVNFCKGRNVPRLAILWLENRFNGLESSGLEHGPLPHLVATR
jgi:hypothetical protein